MKRTATFLIVLSFFTLIMVNVVGDYEEPVTELFYNTQTGYATLIAFIYPVDSPWIVEATYYIIDGGEQQIYSEPFFIGEGTHTIQYWSVDDYGHIEPKNVATYTFDSTPPNIEISSPTKGIYLLGDKIASFGNDSICIGGVPIVVDADDGNGTGIKNVYFNILDDSGYDNEALYEYMFSDAHFGPLTITVTAEDNKGLISEPVEITVIVFSLGLFKYN